MATEVREELPIVPPVRFGRLLREHRLRTETTIDQLSSASGLSPLLLEDVETGRRDLSDERLYEVSGAYGIDPGELVPQRSKLIVDPDEEWISTGGQRLDLDASSPDRALVRYLALVYALRGVDAGVPIPLRDSDLDTLGRALLLDRGDVDRRLRDLIVSSEAAGATRRMRTRRRWLIPAIGAFVGAAAVGSLVLVSVDGPGDDARGSTNGENDAPTSSTVLLDSGGSPATSGTAVDVDIGDAAVQERDSLADQPPALPLED